MYLLVGSGHSDLAFADYFPRGDFLSENLVLPQPTVTGSAPSPFEEGTYARFAQTRISDAKTGYKILLRKALSSSQQHSMAETPTF